MAEFDPYHKWLGIHPKDQPPHHYRLLGIELFESDPDVIDIAADKQMMLLKQCATGPHMAQSQKLLNEVASARLCLLAPESKARYDTALKSKLAAAGSSDTASSTSASASVDPDRNPANRTQAPHAAIVVPGRNRQRWLAIGALGVALLVFGVFLALHRNRPNAGTFEREQSSLAPPKIQVNDALQAAKQHYQDELQESDRTLIEQFDKELTTLGNSIENGNHRSKFVAILEQEKRLFESDAKAFPWSSPMRAHLAQHDKRLRAAAAGIAQAFDAAIAQATAQGNSESASKLTSEKEQFGPRKVARCDCVGGPDKRKWFFVFFSNGKLGSPDGPASWELQGDMLYLVIPSPTKKEPKRVFFDKATLLPDGKGFNAVNQHNYRYAATFVDPSSLAAPKSTKKGNKKL